MLSPSSSSSPLSVLRGGVPVEGLVPTIPRLLCLLPAVRTRIFRLSPGQLTGVPGAAGKVDDDADVGPVLLGMVLPRPVGRRWCFCCSRSCHAVLLEDWLVRDTATEGRDRRDASLLCRGVRGGGWPRTLLHRDRLASLCSVASDCSE